MNYNKEQIISKFFKNVEQIIKKCDNCDVEPPAMKFNCPECQLKMFNLIHGECVKCSLELNEE